MRSKHRMDSKISKRAFRLLVETGYNPAHNPAIAALVAFAAQNSKIDPRNYYSDWRDTNGKRAYASETRSISADFARFKDALAEAAAEKVTDADVIAAAPRTFSGRLEWRTEKAKHIRHTDPSKFGGSHKGGTVVSEIDLGYWEYTAGQYFPTEYRKAAASVLEEATRAVRGDRPPAIRKPRTMAELKALNKENGGCWFSPGSMKFFGTKIESGIIAGRYFITSEQPPSGPRKYSVRSFDDKGGVDTVGDFCAHSNRTAAMKAVPNA